MGFKKPDLFGVLRTVAIAAASILLILAASRVFGGELATSWVNPTKNTDGSSIPATGKGALVGNQVEYGTCSGAGFGVKSGEMVLDSVSTAYTFTGIEPGTWCVRIYTRNGYGSESGASPVASKVIVPPVPMPPTLVTIATTAYELRQYTGGSLRFVAVGTIPLGVPCETPLVGNFTSIEGATITKPLTGGIIAARCKEA